MASTDELERVITNTAVDYAISGLSHYSELYSTDLSDESCTNFLDDEIDPSDDVVNVLAEVFVTKISVLPAIPVPGLNMDNHASAADVEAGLSLAVDLTVVLASMPPQPFPPPPPQETQSLVSVSASVSVPNPGLTDNPSFSRYGHTAACASVTNGNSNGNWTTVMRRDRWRRYLDRASGH
mgnify:CR=1 FL=1